MFLDLNMNETDINVLCRLCLNKSYFYSNIYEGQSSDEILFFEEINYVYDLQISVEDGLPEFICKKCVAMVKEFKLYKRNAHRAQSQLLLLKQKLDSIGIKEEPRYFDNFSFVEDTPGVENMNIAEPQVCIKEEEEIAESVYYGKEFSSGNEEVGFRTEEMPDLLSRTEDIKEKKKFVCDVCEKGFNHKNDFKKHAMTHTNERPNQCPQCGKGFISRYRLNRHLSLHTKHYQCGDCGCTFQRKVEFNKHCKIHLRATAAPAGGKKFLCDKCGKGHDHKNDFKKHVMTHSEERPLHCEECGKGFISRYKLNRHRLVHSGERPFECPECGMRFSRKDHFTNHRRVHSGERPYECEVCRKAYTERSSLRAHMRTHIHMK
ncbi:hypothetical protein J437_LFUL019415 [Ladona fulva]|uniref:Uncharacterized protein n=1 Tax=Ladona fulva TaxID=123851 RepID=A0A8K0KRA2_LADFU|nr:hypothetical protein J437_LFUL019415 [Ladona fulva]